MIPIRCHGPSRFIKEHSVTLRPAEMEDADRLIALNKAFRAEMLQWEVELGRTSPVYPVMDMEDMEYILKEETVSTLIVLCRREGGREKLLGYSYAYMEPWGSDSNGRSRRKQNRKRRGGRHCGSTASSRSSKSDDSDVLDSLYIAELYVIEKERGLGFGELLLCETLRRNSDRSPSQLVRSHLYVSSRNVSAVKCYGKFGYVRSHKSSGDEVHDLVMELDNAHRSATESSARLDRRIDEGSSTEARRRVGVRVSPVPAMPDGPASPSLNHRCSPSSHRLTPEPYGSPSHRSPLHFSNLSEQGHPEILSPSASRTAKNYSVGCKRQSKVAKSGDQLGAFKDEDADRKKFHCRESESHELIVGDLFEINTRHHGGYEKKPLDLPLGLELLRPSFDSSLPDTTSSKKGTKSNGSGGRLFESKGAEEGKPCRFLLTGYPRVALQRRAEEGIVNLGGEVCNTDEFDPTCTHVVCPLPVRTEKFLCGLAAGKHLIHSAYIDHSVQCGRFQPLESFEWFSIAASSNGTVKLSPSSHELTKALLLWSEHRIPDEEHSRPGPKRPSRIAATGQSSHFLRSSGCFGGITAILFVSNIGKGGLRRLLEAGGAKCTDFKELQEGFVAKRGALAFVSMDLLDSEADHVVNWGGSRVRQQALQRLKELDRSGVHCLRAEYLLDRLTKGPSLAMEDYVVKLHGADSLAGKKRQREPVSVQNLYFEAEPMRAKKQPRFG